MRSCASNMTRVQQLWNNTSVQVSSQLLACQSQLKASHESHSNCSQNLSSATLNFQSQLDKCQNSTGSLASALKACNSQVKAKVLEAASCMRTLNVSVANLTQCQMKRVAAEAVANNASALQGQVHQQAQQMSRLASQNKQLNHSLSNCTSQLQKTQAASDDYKLLYAEASKNLTLLEQSATACSQHVTDSTQSSTTKSAAPTTAPVTDNQAINHQEKAKMQQEQIANLTRENILLQSRIDQLQLSATQPGEQSTPDLGSQANAPAFVSSVAGKIVLGFLAISLLINVLLMVVIYRHMSKKQTSKSMPQPCDSDSPNVYYKQRTTSQSAMPIITQDHMEMDTCY